MTEAYNEKQLLLLEELGKLMPIYVIMDKFGNIGPEVYYSQEFRHGEERIPYHLIQGYKRITRLIDNSKTYIHSTNALKIVTTEIDAMTPINEQRKFDTGGFYWIKF